MIKENNFEAIITEVLRDAEEKRQDAGYSGRFDDGGADAILDRVRFFRYGLSKTMPPEWEHYTKKLDPEYATYLRLKKKFE